MKQTLDEVLEKLPEQFNMAEIQSKVEERTPYVVVAFQECERMNLLTGAIRTSLKSLDLGFKVERGEKRGGGRRVVSLSVPLGNPSRSWT